MSLYENKVLKEIKPPTKKDLGLKPSGKICPGCGGTLFHGPVPCPDGKPGCLVLHYGYTCSECGKKWTHQSALPEREQPADYKPPSGYAR